MKVKNIVFSGFAAAILMGTAGANAAIPFQIASKAYVDGQTKIMVNNTETDVADVVADLIGDGEGSVEDKISDAIGDLGDDANGDPYSDVADALADKADASEIGNLADLNTTDQDSVVDAINEIEGRLDTAESDISGKQDTLTTGQGGNLQAGSNVAINIANDVITISATDTTYDTGTASVSGLTKLYTATGSETDGTMTQAAITSALGDKAASSDLTALSNKVGSGTLTSSIGSTAVTNIVDAINALESKTAGQAGSAEVANIQALLTGDPTDQNDTGLVGTVGNANGGLVKDVDDLQDIVGDGQLANGFSNGVDDLTGAVNDLMANKADADDVYTKSQLDTMIGAKLEHPATNTCTAGSGHCVLSLDTSGNLTWVDVTQPWAVTD